MAEVKVIVKMQLPAGKANPAPPVGTALGPHGVDMAGFCKQFNDQTGKLGDTIVPVEITIYDDRSFTFVTKQPPMSILIKQALGLKITGKPGTGSGEPNKKKVGKLTHVQCLEVARLKMPDLNANDEEAAAKIVAGTARSMGVDVEEK